MYSNRVFDLYAARKLGVLAAICKINYAFISRGVEIYQPLLLDRKFRRFIFRSESSRRTGQERYKFVLENLNRSNKRGFHLDIGSNFGFIPLSLAKSGIYSIGVELQFLSFMISKELAYLNGLDRVNFLNGDIVHLYNQLPKPESLSALSILHHIVDSIGDAEKANEFLVNLFGIVSDRVILELAYPEEGNYSWSASNKALHGRKSSEEFYADLLEKCGFKVFDEIAYFKTHLNSERPVLIADRVN